MLLSLYQKLICGGLDLKNNNKYKQILDIFYKYWLIHNIFNIFLSLYDEVIKYKAHNIKYTHHFILIHLNNFQNTSFSVY